jgi:hypothetical protein
MTNEQFDEFVIDLIHDHHGLDNALTFVANKINTLTNGFSYMNGQPFDDPTDSVQFWAAVWDELTFRVELN